MWVAAPSQVANPISTPLLAASAVVKPCWPTTIMSCMPGGVEQGGRPEVAHAEGTAAGACFLVMTGPMPWHAQRRKERPGKRDIGHAAWRSRPL